MIKAVQDSRLPLCCSIGAVQREPWLGGYQCFNARGLLFSSYWYLQSMLFRGVMASSQELPVLLLQYGCLKKNMTITRLSAIQDQRSSSYNDRVELGFTKFNLKNDYIYTSHILSEWITNGVRETHPKAAPIY
ncbi:hypothetical protein M407DRAFT_6007 [Tulasnella calospora MUT 4182]|uniref:Uncharacterized protein n=1 Tax=Tulasnella calospora MUT 4182 TaxID=1051891 RepID=A0A0C3L764_9AGAM|nr:hypothetical protein M407DRAFT_6007 [Tulasnella calospora MUT 4182]